MTRFTNDKKLLDIFVQYYFTKDKYLLFSEERDLEIDLLNSQKAIESSYRFELEKFYQDGIDSLRKWKEKNNYPFQLLSEFSVQNQTISLEVKKIFRDFDSAEKYDRKIFLIKENDGTKLHNLKSQINKIILKNYFPHPHSQQILSIAISHFIEDENQMNLQSFFNKVKNELPDKEITITINNVDQFTREIQKIILIEKPLRELYLLDEILHSEGNPLRNVIESKTDSIIQNQNDTALSDFISFQFFTSLHLRGKNIWVEVMKNNSLKDWYLKKLEEMTKIDELRLNRTKKHRNEIIQKLSC